MGIVLKQSMKNTLILFCGFGIGGINVLFLYTRFLEPDYFGLVTFLLSTANILMPLLVFGIQHTVIKFFSSYKEQKDRDNFMLWSLFLPLVVILPFGLLGVAIYEQIAQWLSRENAIIENYVYLIFIIAIFMGYFEVFYAWSRVQYKSVFGSFVREIFGRLAVTALLLMTALGWMDDETFVYAVVGVYFLRFLLMKIYAFYLYLPPLTIPKRPENYKEILRFSIYIIMAGSAGTILLEIDKFMIPQLEAIAEVAYYSVGVYIASVIAIPSRAMQQIINPITAKEMNIKNYEEVRDLYKRSSLNLLLIGGLLFLLINLNIDTLYDMIGKPEYQVGGTIVLIISLAEIIKLSMGINGAILTNSQYYKILFYYAIAMAISVIVLNRVLIELLGIEGAAISTFIVVFCFSALKIWYVNRKFSMQPYDSITLKILLLTGGLYLIFHQIPLEVTPVASILIKSGLVTLVFVFLALKFELSQDMNAFLRRIFKRSDR